MKMMGVEQTVGLPEKKRCKKWIVEVTIKITNVGQTVDLTNEKKWV